MKQLWSAVISHRAMICSGLILVVSLVGVFYSFWPGIMTFLLGLILLILQYQDEKKRESEMVLINIRLQMGDIVAQAVFDQPSYGGPIILHVPPAPAVRRPMKLSAPPMK